MIIEPPKRPLHHIPGFSQPRSMGLVGWPCHLALHPPEFSEIDIHLPPVSPVSLNAARPKSGASPRPLHRRNRIQKRNGHFPIGNIGGGGQDGERNSVGIRYQVAFAAVFPAIRWVGSCVAPPKTARTEALSTTALDISILPSRPREWRICCQTFCHTPAWLQALKRRQQVVPSPQPSSAGRSFQVHPVRSTKMIPVRHFRSGSRGRPPFGLGGSSGNNGLTSFHSSSVTHWRAIGSSFRGLQ